jgi:hypothetical protein
MKGETASKRAKMNREDNGNGDPALDQVDSLKDTLRLGMMIVY